MQMTPYDSRYLPSLLITCSLAHERLGRFDPLVFTVICTSFSHCVRTDSYSTGCKIILDIIPTL